MFLGIDRSILGARLASFRVDFKANKLKSWQIYMMLHSDPDSVSYEKFKLESKDLIEKGNLK